MNKIQEGSSPIKCMNPAEEGARRAYSPSKTSANYTSAGGETSAGGFAEVQYTTTVLAACAHGQWCLAAGVISPATALTLCPTCVPPPPWHSHATLALACPHGFAIPPSPSNPTGPHPPLPGRCTASACTQAATRLKALSAKALCLPARADPLRWVGEVDMRAPWAQPMFDSLTAAPFGAVALHEHSGAFREAWQLASVRAASVSDRPSTTPPTPPSVHFIAEVRAWHAAYRWSIPLATANPDCHCAAIAAPNAAPARWRVHIRSGAMAEAIAHAVWALRSADLVAMEQPPTLLEHILGPPTRVGHE